MRSRLLLLLCLAGCETGGKEPGAVAPRREPSATTVTVHVSGKSAAKSPVKPSAPAGPARMQLPVPDEPARERFGDSKRNAPVLAPVFRDESAAVVAGRSDARERLPTTSRAAGPSLRDRAATGPEPAGESSEPPAATAKRQPGPGGAVGPEAVSKPLPSSDRQRTERLRNRLSRSTEGLVRERRQDGLETIRFGERFGHVTLLRRTPDGSLHRICVDDARKAEAILNGRPKARTGSAPAAGAPR